MASGDMLFELFPNGRVGPITNGATPGFIEDASTPPILTSVLNFDGATDEHADWAVEIPPQYAGTTGFTFSYKYSMDGVDGDLVEIEIRVLHIDNLDVLTADLGIDTQTPVAIQDDPGTTANDFNYSITGALAKASFGSAVSGDYIVLRATRDISAAVNTDDLQLASILVTET